MIAQSSAPAEKHPRGLYVLFLTEMWERFSFYTVAGWTLLDMMKKARPVSTMPTPRGLGYQSGLQ